MKKKEVNLASVCHDEITNIDLDALEQIVNRLSRKVKKLIKQNGFSKDLKNKAEVEL